MNKKQLLYLKNIKRNSIIDQKKRTLSNQVDIIKVWL